jgi:ketosteroid isomerase-like protein
MDNKALIKQFYQSFASADASGMIACYHDEIQFEDPVFGILKGDDAKNMWRMLVQPGIKITFDQVQADELNGAAHWIAYYTFSQTGNKVVNNISAAFEFKDGKIIKHTDTFNLWTWFKQALGWKGYLLGWTSFLKNKTRQRALAKLKKFSNLNAI